MMNKMILASGLALVLAALAAPAHAGWPGDPAKCKPDAVKAGSVCMDKYEASVWYFSSQPPTSVIKKIQGGTVKLADLMAAGGVQRGVTGADYSPCGPNGNNCFGVGLGNSIYAVSIAGVQPSAYITWFQALAACANSRKRLPSNMEWQIAVGGTADPGPDDNSITCNTTHGSAVPTGSRLGCISNAGAFDMVGNVEEWVADWVPLSTACPGWSGFSNDFMCLSGASTSATGPGALVRGGYFFNGPYAGPLAVIGLDQPSNSRFSLGFRRAR